MDDATLIELSAEETYDLRRRVLRVGTPSAGGVPPKYFAHTLPNCSFNNARKLSGESVIESLEKHDSLASIARVRA